MRPHLLPEWHTQWGVMIAWPHDGTDWAPILGAAEQTYVALASAILAHEHLLVLCRDVDHETHIRTLLAQHGADLSRLHTRALPYNDTWARDFGPIAVTHTHAAQRERSGSAHGLVLLDFRFNGWGGKFAAEADDAVNARLDWQAPLQPVDLILEGGAIDTDGRGNLLTTRQCLLNPNRNPHLDQAGIEQQLRATLGVRNIWWLSQGHLEGDDTDAHVDTLARFCDARTIAYVQCTDRKDSHYPALHAMEQELKALATREGLQLLPLPMTPPLFDEDGERMPATYANFLIINGAVLVPTYQCESDDEALRRLAGAFPSRDVIGIDCLALIAQHGSLHCVTMQLPEGVR